MAKVSAPDGVKLHVEESGSGTLVVFVHEYAGDYRSWEPQVRHFSRQHRCVTYSQRGYPPSDVPSDPARYSQDRPRQCHRYHRPPRHRQGACGRAFDRRLYGAARRHPLPRSLLSVTTTGCGWGSTPDIGKRDAIKAMAAETGKILPKKASPPRPRNSPTRRSPGLQHKDPRGWAEFARMLAEHSAKGHAPHHAQTSAQAADAVGDGGRAQGLLGAAHGHSRRRGRSSTSSSVFLKRTAPGAALLVVPRAGHTVDSEEPAAVNAALAELFSAAEAGRWLAHRAVSTTGNRHGP